jgi:hypothetical protein
MTLDGETTDDAVLVTHVSIADGGPVKESDVLEKVPAEYRQLIPIILGNIARGRPIRGVP